MQTIYLTRRNLQTLLSKLDRNRKSEGSSACTIIKSDTIHPNYPIDDVTEVVALEDEEYYTDRAAGIVHPLDLL